MGNLISKNIRTLALASLLTTAVLGVNAKPAKQGPIVVDQPDGTQLTIRLVGDEFGHVTYTEDGYPLLYNDALGYVYANVASDGSMTESGIKANNIASRTATERNFVAGISSEKIDAVKANLQKRSAARRAVGVKRSNIKKGPGLCTSTYPLTGEQKALVILVEFSDVKFGANNSSTFKYSNYSDEGAHKYFSDELNLDGFSGSGATGSAREWFLFNSRDLNGNPQFMPEFDVYGPVTLPNAMSYYGGNDSYGNDRNPQKMAIHACELLDDEVDFSEYDRDGDGYVDNIYIFYAGYGEADGGSKNTVWPHSWDISAAETTKYKFDGVYIDHYACSNETDYQYKRPDGIGTFVHEFSHVMGLPDLYDTNYGSSYTPDAYSVLDYGPYNNKGLTPPNYSSYERYALGWMEPKEFGAEGTYTIQNLADTNDSYIVNTEKTNEYFLVENRQQTGWDAYIPGHGMLIWHIDYVKSKFDGNIVNNTSTHQYVDLVEANNRQSATYAAGHTFPGTSNVTDYSFVSWSKRDAGVTFSNIAEEDDLITVYAVNSNYDPDNSAVSEIGADVEGTAEYYNLQGIRVLSPEKGDLLIKRSGSTATKVIY